MNPVELPGASSRFADPAKNLPVESHLVDPSRLFVGRVEILSGRVGDAERPRLRLIGTSRRHIAEYRVTRLVVRDVQMNETLELSVAVEHLDAAVVAIGDVDVVLAIDADVVEGVELRRILVGLRTARSARPPRHHPVAVLVELRDPRVPVAIADVDVVVGVESDIGRSAEVPVDVHWRRCPVSTDRYVIVRFVRSLRAAAEIERYITSGVEPYRGMRSLVDDPQVVKAVVAKAVTIGKP